MARGDAFQIDEGHLTGERNRTARRTRFREFLASVVQLILGLGAIAVVLAAAYWLFTSGTSHARSFMTSRAGPWLESLSTWESAVLLLLLLAVFGFVWCLAKFTRLTVALSVWGVLTWCGWILGAALEGTGTGVAAAVLIGATVAPNVAQGLYDELKLH